MDVYFDYCAFIHYVYILYVYACNLWTYLVFILRCNSDGARKVQKHVYCSCLFICLQLLCILLFVANLHATHIDYICINQIFTPLRFFVENKTALARTSPVCFTQPRGWSSDASTLRRRGLLWSLRQFSKWFGRNEAPTIESCELEFSPEFPPKKDPTDALFPRYSLYTL